MAKESEPINRTLAKEIRKAMVDGDVRFEDLGGVSASAWRKRLAHPGRMTIDQLFYICRRCGTSPDDIIRATLKRR